MHKKGLYKRIICSALVLALLLSGQSFLAFAAEPAAGSKIVLKKEKRSSRHAGMLFISELMVKNHATRLNEEGDIADYIELSNISSVDIELEGMGLSDKEGEKKWVFPEYVLKSGEQLLILADKNGSRAGLLCCGFALSHGETVYLTDIEGLDVDSALCGSDTADLALVRDSEGLWQESMYPSPGYPNSGQGYENWQDTLGFSSPLIINEAMVSNDSYLRQTLLGCCDWLEIKNISHRAVELSDWYLSDDDDYLPMWRFPELTIAPGECISVICDDSPLDANPGQLKAPFNLNSQRERVYLSHIESGLADCIFLRDIPYGCSYGRAEGQKGDFFFEEPSPGRDNGEGVRRVSAPPTAAEPDGIFAEGGVEVELCGQGRIYYSSDGSLPDENSNLYKGPFTLDETCIIRALCIEDNAIPSRVLTLSYIIGEGHSLPVLSLVTDDADAFRNMYRGKRKDMEVPGSLALYEDDGSFTVPCGIEMHGETSLELPKKNMSVRLSSRYGQSELEYDVFDGGVTRFSDFILRSGQDFYSTIVRNELLQNLCLQYSDSVPNQRSKHCILYINGEYSGIYALMEKLNRQHYANHMDVSKDSVIIYKTIAPENSAFYREVIAFAHGNDLSTDAAYEEFCRIVDIDSLIDWIIIEGYSFNTDIYDGNIRYCRSDEGDGKWRFMLYDLDSTMSSPTGTFNTVLSPRSTQCAEFIIPLMRNAQFRDRFLTRAGQVLNSTLSDKNVVKELDRLCDLIRPEVARDYARYGMHPGNWEAEVTELRRLITETGWSDACKNSLKRFFLLSDDEMDRYFGN